jgi:hypothetical protein
MPRFYFNLSSKDAHIPDDSGKELATLNDAYEHARKLIHKIVLAMNRLGPNAEGKNNFCKRV